MNDIKSLAQEIAAFCDNRDWRKFHNGKDLAIALSVEASELLETFLWKKPEDVSDLKIREELADVIIYSLRMAEVYGFNVKEIVLDKLEKNKAKYPIEKCKGISKKYTEL